MPRLTPSITWVPIGVIRMCARSACAVAALATIESRAAAALSWLAIIVVMPNIRLEIRTSDSFGS